MYCITLNLVKKGIFYWAVGWAPSFRHQLLVVFRQDPPNHYMSRFLFTLATCPTCDWMLFSNREMASDESAPHTCSVSYYQIN